MSDEHGWPHFFGEFEGFPHLRKHVCEECNSRKLAILEDQFAHTGDIVVLRRLLDIGGRKGHTPIDSFLRGSAGAAPIDLLVLDPQSGQRLLSSVEPGLHPDGIHAHWLNQLLVPGASGEEVALRLPDSVQTFAEVVSFLERASVYPPSRVRWLVFGGLKYIIRVGTQTDAAGYVWEEIEEPGRVVQRGSEFYASVDKDRFLVYRAVAKIALHYLLASSNDCFTGLEPYFSGVKEYILNGGDDSRFVTVSQRPLVWLPENASTKFWCHLACTRYYRGCLSVSLRFFLGPDYPHPPTYDVVLACTFDVTPDYSPHGHCFIYDDPASCKGENVGHVEKMTRLTM